MRRRIGFTRVELIAAAVFILALVTLSVTRESSSVSINRDSKRKTAINTIYANLQEVYFPTQQYYPLKLEASTLKAIDPALLKDPEGRLVGERDSDYRYEPTGCNVDKCSGFMLRADLEREADYVKQSL